MGTANLRTCRVSFGGRRHGMRQSRGSGGDCGIVVLPKMPCCAAQQRQPPPTACRLRRRRILGPFVQLLLGVLVWVVISLVSADSSQLQQSWTRHELLERYAPDVSYEFIEDDDEFDYDNFDLPPSKVAALCRDVRPSSCADWAAAGGCTADAAYMHAHCPVSCHVCEQRVIVQSTRLVSTGGTVYSLPEISSFGIYNIDARTLVYDAVRSHALSNSTLVPQRLVAGHEDDIRATVAETASYMVDEVYQEDRYKLVRSSCRATHPDCAYRASSSALDECEQDATMDWMHEHCAPLCLACDMLHVEARCPIDPNEKHGTCV
jgi:ShK domain-like